MLSLTWASVFWGLTVLKLSVGAEMSEDSG